MSTEPKSPPEARLAEDLQKSLDRLTLKLVLAPHDPVLFNALGVVQGAAGQVEQAIGSFRRAVSLEPGYGEAWMNQGLALEILGRLDEALPAFNAACELTPHYDDAEQKVSALAAKMGRAVPARTWPAPSWVGSRIRRLFAPAVPSMPSQSRDESQLRQSLAQERTHVPNLLALADVLKKARRSIEAECFWRYVLLLEPNNVYAATKRALLAESARKTSEAVAVLSRFEKSGPAADDILPLLLRLRTALCDWDDYNDLYERATDVVRRKPQTIEPFAVLALWDDPELQLQTAKAFAAEYATRAAPMPQPSRPRDGLIRVGYISGDFHQNAVASLKAELFELHDRSRFSIHAYAVGPDDGSAMYRRIASACDRFTSLWEAPAATVAAQIAEDGIDVLVDLSSYTGHGRPDVLALRPAPIQVNDGLNATMGASFMDYIIADRVVVPDGQAAFFTEKAVRLSQPFQLNDRKRPRPTAQRADFGLSETGIVFCSFSTPSKISPALFTTWMRILAQVPDSILWLRGWSAEVSANLRRVATQCGVAPERLLFAENCDYTTHLSRYAVADVALDTLAHGGHTTASDALWMGCPFVTSMGRTFSARVGASLLRAAGMPELVTSNPSEYESLIVRLAREPGALRALRARLEGSRDSCALFDSPATVRQLEWAYQRMWDTHTSGRPPQAFDVPADLT